MVPRGPSRRGVGEPALHDEGAAHRGWTLQWNGYAPGFDGAVKVLGPGGAASSKALPVSEVTVCAAPSSLFTVSVAPGLPEPGVEKATLLIVIVEAVLAAGEAGADDDEPVVDPEDDDGHERSVG